MRLETISFACMMSLGAACAGSASPVTIAEYLCEGDVTVPVTYLSAEDAHYLVLNYKGEQVTLIQKVSASGARYGALDEDSGLIWWAKADDATLTLFEEGKEEVTLLQSCHAKE